MLDRPAWKSRRPEAAGVDRQRAAYIAPGSGRIRQGAGWLFDQARRPARSLDIGTFIGLFVVRSDALDDCRSTCRPPGMQFVIRLGIVRQIERGLLFVYRIDSSARDVFSIARALFTAS